jgi:hypothetical protein
MAGTTKGHWDSKCLATFSKEERIRDLLALSLITEIQSRYFRPKISLLLYDLKGKNLSFGQYPEPVQSTSQHQSVP